MELAAFVQRCTRLQVVEKVDITVGSFQEWTPMCNGGLQIPVTVQGGKPEPLWMCTDSGTGSITCRVSPLGPLFQLIKQQDEKLAAAANTASTTTNINRGKEEEEEQVD